VKLIDSVTVHELLLELSAVCKNRGYPARTVSMAKIDMILQLRFKDYKLRKPQTYIFKS
jgi:hypothetical protein